MAGRIWTKEEIQFLKDNFEKMSCAEIAPHINRTVRATRHMFTILGLERPQPQIGETIHRLTILDKYEKKIGNQNKTIVICQCSCNKRLIKHIILSRIVAGKVQSCGCLRDEKVRERIILMNNSEENSTRSKNRFFQGYEEIHKTYMWQIANGAMTRGLEFKISIEFLWDLYIKQDKKCALSGIDIGFASKMKNKAEQTASVDRIDSNIGYLESNVQWVHKDINRMKQYFTDDYFKELCLLVSSHQTKKTAEELTSKPENSSTALIAA